MAGEPGAIWIGAAHHWVGREGYSPRYIVIHGTAGFTSAQEVGYFFANPATQASTHYVVGRDGVVVQCVDENNAAWANGAVTGVSGISGDGYGNGQHDWWWGAVNPNLLCITIEHVKPSDDNSDLITPAQAEASARLVTHICERWGIPQRKADQSGGITGHYAIDPVNRGRCPGPFPWEQIYSGEDMNIDLSTPGVGNYFEGSDSLWHCIRAGYDYVIGGAILSFYKSYGRGELCGLTYLGLPRSNEIGFGAGRVYQFFERGVLCYDPNHTNDSPPGITGSVYLMHIDGGPGQDPRINSLQGTIVALSDEVAGLTQQVQDLVANCGDTAVVEQLKAALAEKQTEIDVLKDKLHQIAVLANG